MQIKKSSLLSILVLLLLFISIGTAYGVNNETDVNPESGTTEAKKTKILGGNWLPVPIFLTEPAFGYGFGLGLGYFHQRKGDPETATVSPLHDQGSAFSGRSAKKTPPTITGAAAGYTDNDTWFVGVGHSASWREDKIRYLGALAYADVNSTIYVLDVPFDFEIQGVAVNQDLKFRLGSSMFFLGGKLLYLETETQFQITVGEDIPVDLGDLDSRNVGVALDVSFDTRDNTFTPNSGQLIQLDIWRHDEAIGSDYDYWKGTFKLLSFHQLHKRFVLGLRFETAGVDGRAPFYGYPWVSLRGIPALRYQGERTAVAEVEGRFNITEQWAVLGFAGAGAVGGDDPLSETQDDIYTSGVGGRYHFMQDEGLWLGMDVAHGTEDWYWYISIGHAW